MTKPTCAICGWRDATVPTDWNGRGVPACVECATPKTPTAIPNEYGERTRELLRAARFFGEFTTADICDHFEIPIGDRNKMTIMIRRQWQLGRLERLRGGAGSQYTTYRITAAGRKHAACRVDADEQEAA